MHRKVQHHRHGWLGRFSKKYKLRNGMVAAARYNTGAKTSVFYASRTAAVSGGRLAKARTAGGRLLRCHKRGGSLQPKPRGPSARLPVGCSRSEVDKAASGAAMQRSACARSTTAPSQRLVCISQSTFFRALGH